MTGQFVVHGRPNAELSPEQKPDKQDSTRDTENRPNGMQSPPSHKQRPRLRTREIPARGQQFVVRWHDDNESEWNNQANQ
jgi:hypothetical protein